MTNDLTNKPPVDVELALIAEQLRVGSRRLVGLQRLTLELSKRLSELSQELKDRSE